jgi:hypothetical protein
MLKFFRSSANRASDTRFLAGTLGLADLCRG